MMSILEKFTLGLALFGCFAASNLINFLYSLIIGSYPEIETPEMYGVVLFGIGVYSWFCFVCGKAWLKMRDKRINTEGIE